MGKTNSGGNVREKRGHEDWCFVCKDGGDLILCEFMGCRKVYHLKCVDKDESSFNFEEPWFCERHNCFKCLQAPTNYCYCCTISMCENCIKDAEFLPMREKEGFCSCCLELIHFVEGKESYSEEEMEDLKSHAEGEWLFKDYWDVIKQEEGLTLQDLYSAEALLKENSAVSWVHNLEKFSHDEKVSSDCDWKSGLRGKRKMSEIVSSESDWESGPEAKEKAPVSSDSDWEYGLRVKQRALDFFGWASKPLVEFLESVGEDTKREISLFDAYNIIFRYIQEKNLYDPKVKKKIICDDKLRSVFGKKTVQKNKIYHLLESHYVENLDQSEDDRGVIENKNMHFSNSRASSKNPKRQKSPRTCEEVLEEGDSICKTPDNCFASVISENLKLVYLRRGLVEELLGKSNFSGDKVIGSFVNVKLDKGKYQLLPVTGIQTSNFGEYLLEVSALPEPVNISMLSDADFYEKDLEDLREKITIGLIKKPTVVELEEKAKSLHYLITKDRIEWELTRLKYRIDHYNDKGWRALMVEDMQKRDLLMKPSEQERLLQQVPRVIAEKIE